MRTTFEDENPGGIPWSPPDGFENPVPEPGEARRRALGRALPKLIVVGALIIGVVMLVNTAGGIKGDIEQKIDEVQREIEAEIESGGEAGTSDEPATPTKTQEVPAASGNGDGRTDLPGGYAAATFTPRGYMAENSTRQDVDGPYDGSSWQVTQVGDGGVSYAVLRYYKFVPPLATAADRARQLSNTLSYDRSVADGRVRTRKIKIDGRPATKIEYTRKVDGAKQRTIWVLGDPSSFELACTISAKVPEFSEACDELGDSLELKK